MQKSRDLSFDTFRGIAIIAVVAIHVIGRFLPTEMPVMANNKISYLIAYCQLFHFTVPVFIFASGYWLSRKPINSLNDYKIFLLKRLSRILVPYLVWSIVIIGANAIRTADYDISTMTYKVLTGRAVVPYYFVIIIVQLYILAPLLQYLNRKPYGLIMISLFNIVALSAIYFSHVFNIIEHVPAWKPFYAWIFFFQLGLYVGDRGIKRFITPKTYMYIIPLLILSLLLSEAETFFLLINYGNRMFSVYAIKYSSFLYSTCVIFGFLCIREKLERWPKFLSNLGKYSFGVFLIHMPIMEMVLKMIPGNYATFSSLLVYHVIVVLITILICCVLMNASRKILPKTFCTKFLGF
jgi:surface polysaccharide O-acyltransferase-like enzyme